MNFNDAIVLVILALMVSTSLVIGYEFYKSDDRSKMRTLWVQFFVSTAYLYTAYAIYYVGVELRYINGLPLAYVFLLINTPTFVAKVRLWLFIRKK